MGFLKNIWNILSKPSQNFALGTILVAGFGAAFVFFLIFHFGIMIYSSSMEICISCHEMDSVYEEYKESTHYNNPSGVRAECADCHVPHGKNIFGYIDKLFAKIRIGSKDIYMHTIGAYSEPGSFEKVRYELAQNVLEEMRHRDSKECRYCHDYDSMNLEKQDKSGARKHKRTMEQGGKTCVDCHEGIAHEIPDEPEEAEEAEAEEAEQH